MSTPLGKLSIGEHRDKFLGIFSEAQRKFPGEAEEYFKKYLEDIEGNIQMIYDITIDSNLDPLSVLLASYGLAHLRRDLQRQAAAKVN